MRAAVSGRQSDRSEYVCSWRTAARAHPERVDFSVGAGLVADGRFDFKIVTFLDV
jgi:hypothetical protein